MFRICCNADHKGSQTEQENQLAQSQRRARPVAATGTQNHSKRGLKERTLLPEIRLSLLDCAKAHVAGASARDAVQARTPSENGEDVQVLCSSVVCAIDHGRIAQTQGHAELGPANRSFQLAHPAKLHATQERERGEKESEENRIRVYIASRCLPKGSAASSPSCRRKYGFSKVAGLLQNAAAGDCEAGRTADNTSKTTLLQSCAWACVRN